MFERYYRELLNFLSHRVGDRELAADLAQESYARVYGAAGRQVVAEPRALLYATARNLLTDEHRRARVRAAFGPGRGPAQAEDPDADAADACAGPESWQPEVVLAGRQRLAAIEQALAALPPRQREAFVLYKLDGLSRAEVASAMGVGVRTVERHLEMAMAACMQRLAALDALDVPQRKAVAGDGADPGSAAESAGA